MTPREFLIGWVMEFGGARVHAHDMYPKDWYMGRGEYPSNPIDVDQEQGDVDETLVEGLMEITYTGYNRYVQITQAGLDYIKGEQDGM